MIKPKLILASASIGRKQLLEKLGVPFEVIKSTIDEDTIDGKTPEEKLQNRARAKAEDVVSLLFERSQEPQFVIPAKAGIYTNRFRVKPGMTRKNDLHNNSYLIVAADSEAVLDGKTYGKAKDKTHAKEIVTALMGKTHDFVTATYIINLFLKSPKWPKSLKEIQRWENTTITKITTRHLNADSLNAYIARYDFTRFAAGYALNETPWDLVTKIDGSYTNVIGLPFEVLLPIVRSFGLLSS